MMIRQPGYMPNLGFFKKIQSSDIFVFLDDVQFSKDSFDNRNQIKTNFGPEWITVPLNRPVFEKKINEKIIASPFAKSFAKKNNSKIDFWISEKDKGIYDAFNKGLSYSKGDLIGFVNSGDTLTEESLTYLTKYYNSYPEIDFIFGSVKKHWGVVHGYKPQKIKYSWGFYSSHSTGFFIKRDSHYKKYNWFSYCFYWSFYFNWSS